MIIWITPLGKSVIGTRDTILSMSLLNPLAAP